jgi:tetratricopeptide (TPR) repeat protein
LVGRASLFNDISGTLAGDQAVLLYGIPGVGKHALVATLAANRIHSGQPVLWLNSARDNLQQLAGQVLRAYDMPASDDAMVSQLLDEHAPLIVLDGIRVHEVAAQFIRQYTVGKSSVIVLHETAADGPWDIKLMRRLDADASAQLFADMLAVESVDDPARLLDALKGHPLSIRLAALQVGIVSVADLAEQFPETDDAPLERAGAVIAQTFSLLDAASQGLLLLMAASFADGLSVDLLDRVLGTSAQALCQTLISRGFVIMRPLYYALHPLIQQFAVNHLRANARLPEAQRRMLEAIVAFTDVHANSQNEDMLLLEIDNILNAAHFARHSGDFHALNRLVDSLSLLEGLLTSRGYQSELARLQQFAQQARPPEEATVIETDTAILQTPTIEPDEVIDAPTKPKAFDEWEDFGQPQPVQTESRALSLYSDLEAAFNEAVARRDRPEMARLCMQIGQRHLDREETGLALDRFEQAMALYQEIGDLANLLDALELLALNSGPDDAFNLVRRGLNIANQLGDDGRRCRFMGIMGDLHASLGDASNAMEAYKRTIKLSRLLEDEELTGVTLGKLAAIYMDYGRYREATVALSQAIALFEAVRRPDLQGRSLGNLGTALGHLGRWHEAGQRHAAALRIARHLGDVDEERFQLRNLAFVAESEGHFHWAVNYNRQALYLALLDDDDLAIGELSFELGRLLLSDPEAIGQAVVLLENAAAYDPQPETQRLLKESRTRLKRRERSGQPLAAVEADILVYAGDVYRHYSGGQ